MGREYPGQPVLGVGAIVLRPCSPDAASDTVDVEVLLVRRANPPSQGEWSLPGGVVELGERLEQAVVREVFEETGLHIHPGSLVEVLDSIVHDDGPTLVPEVMQAPEKTTGKPQGRVRFHYVLVDFVCHVTGGTLASSSDATAVCWQPVSHLSTTGEHALRPKTIEVIRKACDPEGRPAFSRLD